MRNSLLLIIGLCMKRSVITKNGRYVHATIHINHVGENFVHRNILTFLAQLLDETSAVPDNITEYTVIYFCAVRDDFDAITPNVHYSQRCTSKGTYKNLLSKIWLKRILNIKHGRKKTLQAI